MSVEPIVETDSGDPDAETKQPTGDPTAAARDAKPKPRPKVRRPRPRPVKKPIPKASPAISRKAVEKKFSVASREYRRYQKKFGERLAGEWADLATYVQFARSEDRLKQADRRLDRFRSKMRKSKQ